jgi:hypothetical protein
MPINENVVNSYFDGPLKKKVPKIIKHGPTNATASSASSLKTSNTMIKNPQLVLNKLIHMLDPKEALIMTSKEMSAST